MAFELKEGQGSLFKNDRKEAENHADYRGEIMVGGKMYWLNAYIKKAASGKTYMSVSAKPKEAKQGAKRATSGFDDSIPF